MSADDPAAEDLAHARQAVDEAAAALAVVSGARVPSRELAEARRKLKTAEKKLDQARKAFARETGTGGLRPGEPEDAPRRRPRT